MVSFIQDNLFAFITLGGVLLILIIRDVATFFRGVYKRKQALAAIAQSTAKQDRLLTLMANDRLAFLKEISAYDERSKKAEEYMKSKKNTL
jgi:hypothetical protein